MASNKETIIISLGGSLVAPGLPAMPAHAGQAGEIEIDIEFLKKFRNLLQKYIGSGPSAGSGFKFFIFVGGGKVARNYQKALLEFGANDADRDWMGINVSRLNAEIVKQLFSEFSYSEIITDPNKKICQIKYREAIVSPKAKLFNRVSANKNIFVGAGFKPGFSTDYVSVLSAKTNNIKTIINLTNIDYVYDKNPTKFSDAKPIKEISWPNFRKIVGDKWSPGLSMPFDPRASKMAEKLKLKVAIINGKNLERLEDFLNNKPFIGTIIS